MLVASKNINKLKHSLHALAIYDFVSLFVYTVFTLKLSGLFEFAIYSLFFKDYIDREVASCQWFSECKIFCFSNWFFLRKFLLILPVSRGGSAAKKKWLNSGIKSPDRWKMSQTNKSHHVRETKSELPSRVAQWYYKHGLFLSSYPTCASSLAICMALFSW